MHQFHRGASVSRRKFVPPRRACFRWTGAPGSINEAEAGIGLSVEQSVEQSNDNPPAGNQFGTFGGVFTPSILTIFGLIMFMRANFVLGHAGVWQSFLIVTICSSITLLTGLSISAISSNTPVKGGGAYFLISRVLGPSFGSAIGIALFFAQALSVPFYILGFTEALVRSVPAVEPYAELISFGTLAVLFVLSWVGADWAIKVQFVILTVLSASIIVFLTGAWHNFDPGIFRGNLSSHYESGRGFWKMLAIYFPAVTGIMAGVNMSGDLRNPARSIPLGTISAILLSYIVYAFQMVICGGLAAHDELTADPYGLLVRHAFLGLGWLVAASVFCATISSAIGSSLGAPRVLQAVGRDRILKVTIPFGIGSGKKDEPRRALILSTLLAVVTLGLAARAEGGEGLNIVASAVTMVFLYTYGMTNLAAFVEALGANPSFRPRFRIFHWSTALAGAFACLWVAFLISAPAALSALLIIGGLYQVTRSREMEVRFGDARRGFVYSRVCNNLIQLAGMPMHVKNWRPTIMVLSGSPNQRLGVVQFAQWIGNRSGIISLVNILEGDLTEKRKQAAEAQERLVKFASDCGLNVFPEVIVCNKFDLQLSVVLQTHSIGPIKPNMVMLGWPQQQDRIAPYYEHVRTIRELGKAIVIVLNRGFMPGRMQRRIDCWWRGRENGSMMVTLSHLIMLNSDWRPCRLRLLRVIGEQGDVPAAEIELRSLCDTARIEADVAVVPSAAPFGQVLREQSQDATLIVLGFSPPTAEEQSGFHATMSTMVEDMPSVLLVHASGQVDLRA